MRLAKKARALSRCILSHSFFCLAAMKGTAQTSQEAPVASPDSQVMKMAPGVTPPVAIHTVDAKYPREASKNHLSGSWVVTLIIDTQGLPQNVILTKCSDPVFGKSSLQAVSRFRFRPARYKGKPVAVQLTVEQAFNVRERRKRKD